MNPTTTDPTDGGEATVRALMALICPRPNDGNVGVWCGQTRLQQHEAGCILAAIREGKVPGLMTTEQHAPRIVSCSRCERAEAKLEAAERDATQLRADLDKARSDLAARDAELMGMRGELARLTAERDEARDDVALCIRYDKSPAAKERNIAMAEAAQSMRLLIAAQKALAAEKAGRASLTELCEHFAKDLDFAPTKLLALELRNRLKAHLARVDGEAASNTNEKDRDHG